MLTNSYKITFSLCQIGTDMCKKHIFRTVSSIFGCDSINYNILIYLYIFITKTNIFSVLQHETAKHVTYIHNRIHLLGSRPSSLILAHISLITNPSHFYKIWKPGNRMDSFSLMCAHTRSFLAHMSKHDFRYIHNMMTHNCERHDLCIFGPIVMIFV